MSLFLQRLAEPDCGACFAIMRLQGYDNVPPSKLWIIVALSALLGLMGLWRAAILVSRWWNTPINSPSRLWKALVRAHALSPAETKVMERLARQMQPESALNLFVDPSLWRQELDSDDSISKGLSDHRLKEDAFQKVFGFPPS